MTAKKILVQVSVTEHDIFDRLASLRVSLTRIVNVFGSDASIYIVYQTTETQVDSSLLGFLSPHVKLEVSRIFNASLARNMGIAYAKKYGYHYIYFHDSSITVGVGFAKLMRSAVCAGLPVAKGVVVWDEAPEKYLGGSLDISCEKLSLIFNCYVWSYIFSLNFLGEHRFSEHVGPGSGTRLKAGEDLAFLYQIFEHKLFVSAPVCRAAIVFHPPRPKDKSKELAYGESQGVLLRWLISRNRLSPWVWVYFVLFFGNGFFSICILKPKARDIFLSRIKGFSDAEFKRKFFD